MKIKLLKHRERKYLLSVMKPFINEVLYFKKASNPQYNAYFIEIVLKNGDIANLPMFQEMEIDKSMKYKGLVPDVEYYLEDL